MVITTKKGLASLEFTLHWKSGSVRHSERLYAKRVNFWRDILTDELLDQLAGKSVGDHIRMKFSGEDLFTYDPSKVFQLEDNRFDRKRIHGRVLNPRFGRFYPAGLLKGLRGIFGSNSQPFRCVGVEPPNIVVDFNHPMAASDFELEITIHDTREKNREIGGQMVDWMEVIADGPGMQARWKDRPTDFFSDDPFDRSNEADDAFFYKAPRLVTHADDQALEHIRSVYGRFLRPGMRVLDLMSSWRSHVPESIQLESLVGLGMNEEEMKDNPQLTEHIVHDLNKEPALPFDDKAFNAILCTVSVEYMTRPFEVFRDCARVLKRGGVLVHTFSNRWFPPKVVNIWKGLNEFERMGLVLEYFLESDNYEDIETLSMRGWPRPFGDQYYPQVKTSDPVYAVAAKRKPEHS